MPQKLGLVWNRPTVTYFLMLDRSTGTVDIGTVAGAGYKGCRYSSLNDRQFSLHRFLLHPQ